MDKRVAIKIKNVSKTFFIPHERVDSIRAAAENFFKTKKYEKFEALKNISFEIKKGDFFGIVGRNGSGKSTLLKILSGIYEADEGGVEINGRISPFLELGIGFNPELSGRDNIYLNASVLGLSKKEIDKKFDSIVGFSELGRFIDQKLKNYSSGMQVRLAFSVSIHANRDILLMDEILAVGDLNFQSKCLEEFNRYKRAGKTVVIVTHDISIIERYCNRAVLLRNGKLEQMGKPEEVGRKYNLQNIRDEEKRISLGKRKETNDKRNEKINEKNNEETGYKKAEITGVDFLDENKEIKNVFQSGREMTIRVRFKFNEDICEPLIGIAIFNGLGVVVYGTNNYKRKKRIDFVKKDQTGYVDFIFEKLSLIEGEHKVNVAIGRNSKGLICQMAGKLTFFVNKGELRDYGIANLSPEVRLFFNKNNNAS
jgi:ABC-type polysaccharide/polyol phosphate transport system ATPase subunit